MTVKQLDDEFMRYWSRLTVVEKESLLHVAQNYVHLKDEEVNADDLRKQLIREEREKYLKGEGKSYKWEDVKEMAVNKEKRNGLQT